jgi:hypothetical protein
MMMRIRSLIFAPIAVLSMLVGVLAFGSVSAQASPTDIGSFGPEGPTSSSFAEPESIAVEQSTGDVYVYEIGKDSSEEEGNVYKFNAEGKPEEFSFTKTNVIEGVGGNSHGDSQIAVDSSSGPAKGDIYIATGEKVLIYNSEGEKIATLTEENEPVGVAVDSSGAVYVSFFLSKTINKYIPGANPVTTADYTCSLLPSSSSGFYTIAVDSAENLWLSEKDGEVTKFETSQCNTEHKTTTGTHVTGAVSGQRGTLAADPNDGDVYINEGSHIVVYNSVNTEIEEFGSLGNSFGVAVSDVSGHAGDVYASAAGETGEVIIFGPASASKDKFKVIETGSGAGAVKCEVNLSGSFEPCAPEYAEGAEVTVKAEPNPGSELASFRGAGSALLCSASPCTFIIKESSSVTATFTAEVGGKGGPTGPSGPTGPPGPTGPSGSTGPSGPLGSAGAKGEEGKEGKVGANGTSGEKGVPGPAGPAGPQGSVGPVGAQGPAGPAGQIELVTCKTVKKGKKSVQQCTTKLVSGTVKFTAAGASAQATLSRHGAVYAAGTARVAYGHMSLRLSPLRRLRPGRYTLTLIGGAGRHETIQREAFTLR